MTTALSRDELLDRGMSVAVHAAERGDRPALISDHGTRTWAELNARANQLVRALRDRGVRGGDGVALVCANRPEFWEVVAAVLRAGWRLTPINWHLTADEIAYIAADSDAAALIGDARFAGPVGCAARQLAPSVARLAVGGPIDGFEAYDDALARQAGSDIADPSPGDTMLYTSGTTGRPKGVRRPPGNLPALVRLNLRQSKFRPDDHRVLGTGPLYHAAPLAAACTVPMTAGVTTVLMDGWEPEQCLRLVEQYRITHMHLVPTMFHRLLALPEAVRRGYDISSLRYVNHGAAPCPVDVKRRMMEWFGPIIHEYYAATEGAGTIVTPQEWLAHPGTVGRPEPGHIEIRDDHGRPVPAGEVGFIWIRSPGGPERFEYHKDPAKTARTYDQDYFTLGDMGYLDEHGWLYLTGRTAELIISGGVNIYPAEVDAVLLEHPAVADCATVGVPNEEWGEEVKAVVQLRDGVQATPALEAELLQLCRQRLAGYKCPRSVDVVGDLPRHDTGKIYRRLVRDRYWPDG